MLVRRSRSHVLFGLSDVEDMYRQTLEASLGTLIMRHLRFHIIHILAAHLMAAPEGVPTYYIRTAAIRRGDSAQVSLDWTAWGHDDGLRWCMQRVGVCFQTVDDNACPKTT